MNSRLSPFVGFRVPPRSFRKIQSAGGLLFLSWALWGIYSNRRRNRPGPVIPRSCLVCSAPAKAHARAEQ